MKASPGGSGTACDTAGPAPGAEARKLGWREGGERPRARDGARIAGAGSDC